MTARNDVTTLYSVHVHTYANSMSVTQHDIVNDVSDVLCDNM